MAAASPPSTGLIALAPAAAGAQWRWWRVGEGALWSMEEGDLPPAVEGPATVLVPAALSPVLDRPMPGLPVPQALAAARLAESERQLGGQAPHVAVAADGVRLLVARVAPVDMDAWLAACAAAGLPDAALVPAALVLPRPDAGPGAGTMLADLAGQHLARTPDAAFAAEDALLAALTDAGAAQTLDDAALAARLAAVQAAPPLDLRQGVYARARVSFLALPDWRSLARMAACAALLALAVLLVWIVRWNHEASRQEALALAAVQVRFPTVTDVDSAERVVAAELVRRGTGASGFGAPTAALLDGLRGAPGVALRDLGYAADGTLRFTAAAPRPEDINAVLVALQQAGWKVTVPPSLAPDPTGAIVAAITVRAP
ncbi:type II secretion system protein GspL [Novosphingobium cyanobacteriorum]|uniref:Type II secretion system protein GspL n=1 Tax=Novosphingobium cyanobacteriorum TaxID=3024215 RepID=A0ABT6CFV5_9SPHN|nr:type II secretion system protein GspL [Novosphingobium cyanobacteriorum]MDF8332712.1 type II secretion system protein GspL [Novosphingobium cyanobacteriorum]